MDFIRESKYEIYLKRMKRYIISLLSLFAVLNAYSEGFVVKSGTGVMADSRSNVILTNVAKDLTIEFSSGSIDSTGCRWYTYTTDPDSAVVLKENEYSVDSASTVLENVMMDCGYIVEYGDSTCSSGERCRSYLWVAKYRGISSVTWNNSEATCDELCLKIQPTMYYVNSLGVRRPIVRHLSYSYKDYTLSDKFKPDTTEFSDKTDADTMMCIPKPALDTKITITDELVQKLGLQFPAYTTELFKTTAPKALPLMRVDDKFEHEADPNHSTWSKDDDGRIVLPFNTDFSQALADTSKFKSSSPITIDLMSYPNSSVSPTGYVWEFVSGERISEDDFAGSLRQYDSTVYAYKFTDPGLHCVKLTVASRDSMTRCKSSSYACFRVSESAIYVPNAFTPNGDGINDEFKVAYRSIASYRCRIYDQWGTKVYDSEDITSGWDGTVYGSAASIGVYFYVIEAKGVDGTSHNKKGAVNLLRSK